MMGLADHMRPSSHGRVKTVVNENGFSENEMKLGKRIKSIYIAQRTAFDRRIKGIETIWRSCRRYDQGVSETVETKAVLPVWITLARFFREKEINPYDYINFHFQKQLITNPLEPFQLKTDKNWQDYEVWKKKEVKSILIAFRTQKSICTTNIQIVQSNGSRASNKEVYVDVLTDEALELSALFRYCLARSLNLKDIASIYEQQAAMQFYCNPDAYLKIWKKWLPQGFHERARKLFKQTVGEKDA